MKSSNLNRPCSSRQADSASRRAVRGLRRAFSARAAAVLLGSAAVAGLLPGCVAIPLGGTQVFTARREDGNLRRVGTPRVKAVAAGAWAEGKQGGKAAVGLQASEKQIWQRERQVMTVNVRKTRWLSMGVAPCMAESTFRGDGNLRPVDGFPRPSETDISETECLPGNSEVEFWGCILFPVLSPVVALFGPWECSSHYWDGPNVQYLTAFSPQERKRIGALTWRDDPEPRTAADNDRHAFSHSSLAGFHKYCSYKVENPVMEAGEPAEPEEEIVRRKVSGSYEVAVSIPSLDWSGTGKVLPGAESAEFVLPEGTAGGEFEMTVRFTVPKIRLDGERDALLRKVLQAANGQNYRVRVQMPE